MKETQPSPELDFGHAYIATEPLSPEHIRVLRDYIQTSYEYLGLDLQPVPDPLREQLFQEARDLPATDNCC